MTILKHIKKFFNDSVARNIQTDMSKYTDGEHMNMLYHTPMHHATETAMYNTMGFGIMTMGSTIDSCYESMRMSSGMFRSDGSFNGMDYGGGLRF